MTKVLSKVRVLLELVKFEHSVFALPYAFIGALYAAATFGRVHSPLELPVWVAPYFSLGPEFVARGGGYGWPTWRAILWITLVMVGARAVAFVLNRAIDREVDARNPRTSGRAIPAGQISTRELWLFSALMLAFYLFGIWQLAPIVRSLWLIPLAAFLVYPYLKRYTALCHYWLGACLGLAPVGAWVAVGAPLSDPAPWVLGIAVTLWTAGFDMIYATQDVECDRRDGLHSAPADLGVRAALTRARVLHALTVVALVDGGVLAHAGAAWYVGVGVAAALLWYENSIVSAEDLSRVNAAFALVNGAIAILLLVAAVADRLLA